MCSLINTNTHTHTLIPPWEDQREWHRMTRMTTPDCAVMCSLINTHTHTHTHTHTQKKCRRERVGSVAANSDNLGSNKEAGGGATRKQGGERKVLRAQVRFVQVERVCPLCRV